MLSIHDEAQDVYRQRSGQERAIAWLILSFVALAGDPIRGSAYAGPIVPSNFTLIDTSSGSNTTTASGTQTGWQFTTGSAGVDAPHFANANLYYFGYMFDGSYTFNTTTGAWSGTSNNAAATGYLSSAADAVTVTMVFSAPQNVGMMRFYPCGYSGFVGTDYAVSYHDGTGWKSVVSSQAVAGAASPQQQTFRDNTFAPVNAQQWRIALTNGIGGYLGNATFGEVQFFTAAVGDYFWAPAAGGGGDGTWSAGNANWAPAAGQLGAASPAVLGTLIFGDAPGTVTVSGSVNSSAGLKFSTDGYILTGGSGIALTGNSPTVNTITADAGVRATIDSVLTGTSGLNKEGGGTLTLGGANTYTGGTLVTAGTLTGNAVSLRGTITNDATLTFNQASSGTFADVISGAGVFIKEGAATLTVSLTGSNNFSNSITIGTGTLEFGGSGYLDTTNYAGQIVNNGSLMYSSAATQTLSGTISGSGGLVKSGIGTLTLSAANTYGGATVIKGGAVSVGTLTNAGVAGPTGTNATIALSGGGKLSYTGTTVSTNRSIDLTGGAGEIAVTTGATTLTIAGAIGNTGSLVKSGAGTLALSGSNSHIGTTSVTTGTLALANVNALRSSTLDTGTVGAQTVIFTVAGTNTYVLGGLQGADALAIGVNSLEVGGNGGSTTFSGTIGGTGGLSKVGAGALTLTGSSTYSGATTIAGGRIVVGPAGSINSTSGITITGGGFRYNASTALSRPLSYSATGGTLSGTGVIAVAVTAGTNAVLSPGNSPGTQTFTSGLTWEPGGTYDWELNALIGSANTNWDLINATGSGLNLAGLSAFNSFHLNLTTLTGSNTPGPLDAGYMAGSTYEFLIAGFSTLTVPAGYSNAANSDLTELFTVGIAGWQGPQPSLSDFTVKVNSAGTGLLLIVPEPGAITFAGIGMMLAGWSALRCHSRRPVPGAQRVRRAERA